MVQMEKDKDIKEGDHDCISTETQNGGFFGIGAKQRIRLERL